MEDDPGAGSTDTAPASESGHPKRGEIYFENFDPVVGRDQGGRRPCLIIQNDVSNEHSPVVIVALITSRLGSRSYPYDVVITPEESGLPQTSRVLLNQLRTIDKHRLGTLAGTLAAEKMAEVDEAVRVSLGLLPT